MLRKNISQVSSASYITALLILGDEILHKSAETAAYHLIV